MVKLELDGTPPSLNRLMYRNWRVHQKVKREWQGLLQQALMVSPLTKLQMVQDARPYMTPPRAIVATAELWFATRRQRDEGNYRSILEKCLGDALTNCWYLDDDDYTHFRFGTLRLHSDVVKPLGRTVVYLYVSDG